MKPEFNRTYLFIHKILFLTAFTLFIHTQLTAQNFFGVSSTPADNNPATGPTITIIPPASMQAGDLVILFAQYRATTGTLSVATTGGQSWVTEAASTGSTQNTRIFWCRFNGTWASDPQITAGAGNTQALTGVMYVFRPSSSNSTWAMDAVPANQAASGTNPNSITGITPTFPNSVTMAFWSSAAANTWGTLTGTGWLKTGLDNQNRNTSTSGQTHTAAYKILGTAAATGNVAQTQSTTTTALKTIATWYEIPNNECANAILLNTNSTCTNITGTVAGATASAVSAPACGGSADDDVWYRFVPTTNNVTITLSSLGANLSASGARIEVFSGSCTGLTSVACGASPLTASSLTAGTTYYLRVYSFGSSALTSLANFNICITEQRPANVSTGKSFINKTRPGGGTVVPGDELEIRVSVNVSNAGINNIFRLRFNDTLPANVTYVPGSLRLLTNEAKVYASYTDNAGDDAAMYNSINRTIRFNLGRDTTNMSRGVVSNTGIDSTSGGYVRSNTHAPRGNGMLVIVTYRVTVDASTAYSTIINYGSGALRYRNTLSAVGTTDYELAPNMLSFIVYPNYGLCSNATGSNSITAGNGDFSSGTSHNGLNPGAAVPGYNFVSVTTGNPGDGNYAVVKNLSPSQSTNMFVNRPQSPSVDRVFGVWDIIGDHTSASDPLAGNAPSASGANGGYMLAVNAAYQLSVANFQNISGLCENTYYEFSAWFRNVCKRCGIDSVGRGASGVTVNASYIPTAPGDSSGVKPNLTFQIDGIDYYVSGDIDYVGQWGQWVKKGFVFRTGPGQTSLTVSIKNNAPGGGGNDWVMDDISFTTCLPNLQFFPTASNQLCANSVVEVSSIVNTFFDNYKYYQWERSTDNGVTWAAAPLKPGIDSFQYTNSGGTNRDTVYYPQFIASVSQNGHQYRLRIATTIANLSNNQCNIYQAADIVILNITNCTVLPVTITQFNGKLVNGRTRLFWASQNETPQTTYFLERSDDGTVFYTIGKISAKVQQGSPSNYEFTDAQPFTGKAYYRLKMVSNGNSKYSHTIQVLQENNLFDIRVLNNPFQRELKFEILSGNPMSVQIQLLDMFGRKLKDQTQRIYPGATGIVITDLSLLQKSTYVLIVKSGNSVITKQVQNY